MLKSHTNLRDILYWSMQNLLLTKSPCLMVKDPSEEWYPIITIDRRVQSLDLYEGSHDLSWQPPQP